MKTITVLTATRAEYGLLKPVILALNERDEFKVKTVVTGAHLSPEFGLTYKEIENDGIEIDGKIEILMSADTPSAVSKSMGLAMISFADYFAGSETDALLVLGDRYETLAVCCAAMNERIPIIHMHGGETTEGAVDEAIRHAITKLSYLHLTSTEEYRKRVIQLGESPDRVFTVGATGIDNILNQTLLSKSELAKELDINTDSPYAVVTFHPVTLESSSAQQQCEELLRAFERRSDINYIVTKANADADGRIINRMLDEYAANHKNVRVYSSLGVKKYLSALKYAHFVMGNSSSGLLEVPSFGIPTINIGDRQKGRIKADSVIDCQPWADDICRAIELAETDDFRNKARKTVNPYGDGNATKRIVEVIGRVMDKEINLKKRFFDIRENI